MCCRHFHRQRRMENYTKGKRLILPLLLLLILVILIAIIMTSREDSMGERDSDDEIIESMLHLHIARPKRSTSGTKGQYDMSIYKEMGWELTPKEALEVFNSYYECLSKRESIKTDLIDITAVLSLEGQNVELKCPICLRPDQDSARLHVEWQRMRARDSVMRYIDENSKFKKTKEMSLIINSVDITDAGQYFCVRSHDREYEQIYQLDVLFRERRKVLKESEKENMLPVFNMTENNLETYTLWSDWSDCNMCGRMGHRRKIGLCMVKKINDSVPVEPEDLPIIALYPKGIPCRSTVLPKSISKLKRIRYRRSETLLGNCYQPCPTVPPTINVTDKNGRVVEVVNPGYYSLRKKPPLPSMVIRKVVYEETGKRLVLKCPTKPRSASLVRWQNKTVIINPLNIRRQTRGRVRTDSANRLHIRSLRLYDSAPYSCWVKRKHVATIKVIVTKAMNKNLKDYITYAGLGLTIISVTLVCCCVCWGRNRKTMK